LPTGHRRTRPQRRARANSSNAAPAERQLADSAAVSYAFFVLAHGVCRVSKPAAAHAASGHAAVAPPGKRDELASFQVRHEGWSPIRSRSAARSAYHYAGGLGQPHTQPNRERSGPAWGRPAVLNRLGAPPLPPAPRLSSSICTKRRAIVAGVTEGDPIFKIARRIFVGSRNLHHLGGVGERSSARPIVRRRARHTRKSLAAHFTAEAGKPSTAAALLMTDTCLFVSHSGDVRLMAAA
jgi:hypothetical protein